MLSYFKLLKQLQHVGFDGDDDSGGDGGDGGGDGKGAKPDTISRAEFDTHMAGLRKKYESRENELKETQRQLAEQLEQAKKSKGLSEEERQEYDKRIQQLEGSFLTEKEKLERKSNAQKNQYEQQIADLVASRDLATLNFQTEVVRNQIFAAQSANKGVDPDQFDAILSRMIKWEDELVDGESNGRQTPVVHFQDVDKNNKPVMMKYSIDEAVKRMKELPKYANLFEDNLKSGLGGKGNIGSSGKVDIVRLARENPAEYRRLRKEQPELFSS